MLYLICTVAIILGGMLWIKKNPDKPTEEPEAAEVIAATTQSFEVSINNFSQLSERAKATFMYRFVQSLSKEQAMKLQEYISKLS